VVIGAIILAQKSVFAILLFTLPSLAPSSFSTETSVARRFYSWDSEHYLYIAEKGYSPKAGHCAFYPLWPGCIHAATTLTTAPAVLSGYVLANLCSFLGLLLFHRFAREKHDLRTANRATILLLLYPGSVFFFFPYTESLFLLLSIICLLCLHMGNTSATAIAAFLLPMARPVGIFILPYLLWELFRKRSPRRSYLVCAAPLLGYLCYFGIMYFFTGNPFEGFTAQQQFPAKPSIARIGDLAGFAQSFADFVWHHDMTRSFIDRGAFFLFLCSLYWIWRMDSGYLVYCIFMGLIPAMSNSLMSYSRFLSVVFPFFILFATLPVRRSWLFYLLCAGCGAVQIYFFIWHASGQWVG
jgi:hypothetical protein